MIWYLIGLLICAYSIEIGNAVEVSDYNVADSYTYGGYSSPSPKPACQHCGCGERNEDLRVVGGSETDVNAYPWAARLVYHMSYGCGTTLINDRYVISAAHCVQGFMFFMFRVKFGEHNRCKYTNRDSYAEIRYITQMYVHNFTIALLTNDVSLLKLNKPIEYTYRIRPVCLPKPSHIEESYVGTLSTVTGWGAMNESGAWSCTLRETQLPVISNQECKKTKYNESKIHEEHLCAGYPETAHKDACTGDSGGPLVAENKDNAYELIGIVSFGYGCARKGFPGVYTRITKYLGWIAEHTDDACYCAY